MTLAVTILGCGSSGGVPRVGGDWGACDPTNPKNRRRRCALLIERIGPAGSTRVLVDTGPDMREQLLSAEVPSLDAVVYTHPHADHIHGIDDLRGFAIAAQRRMPVYLDAETLERAMEAFAYCFRGTKGYPAILDAHVVAPGETVRIAGEGGPIALTPFRQVHGRIGSLGWRVGGLAYSSDLNDVPEESFDILAGLDVWIVDALRYAGHPSHFNVREALEWIERLAPRRAVVTNLHQDLDHERLKRQLPGHVEPAFDMMRIELPDPA